MTAPAWITNDPQVAERLRLADSIYAERRHKALCWPLELKVTEYREAKEQRARNYERAAKGEPLGE